MVVMAQAALQKAGSGTPIPFFMQRFLALCRRMGPYAKAAWGRHRGFATHETAGVLHRLCRNRRSDRLRRRKDRRALVTGNKLAGIPQPIFLHAVGRVAPRREGALSSGSTPHARDKGTAGVARGFLTSHTRKYVEWRTS